MSTRDSRYSVGWNILYPPLVSPYASPQGKKTINQNGSNIDVAEYVTADVDVQPNLGTKSITTNGTYNASSDNLDGYSQVVVETPVPSGALNVTVNGDYDVTNYVQASVSVPGSPSGKITIRENGTDVNIAQYATADIIVPQGITPTGNINILADALEKVVDVTQYAQATVTNSLYQYSDYMFIQTQNQDIHPLVLPYDTTKVIQSVVIIPITVDKTKNRNMCCCYYRWTTYPADTVIKFHTFTNDTKYEETDYYQEGSLVGSYIPDPVIDSVGGTVTVSGRNDSYQWKANGFYIAIITYEYVT